MVLHKVPKFVLKVVKAVSHALLRYQERLTDLSSRNTSFFLNSLSDKNHFDTYRLLPANPSLPLQLLSEKSVRLVPVHPQDEDEVLLSESLKRLFREIDSIEKETGKNNLYISYGLLEGEISPKEYARAPIVFIPARLRKVRFDRADYWVVERQEEDKPFVNRALTTALRHFRKIDLNLFVENVLEEHSENPLATVRSVMRELGFETTISSEEMIEPFEKVLKSDAAKILPAVPRIRPFLLLGKFQQSSTSLIKDYEQMIKNPPTSGLFASLTGLVDKGVRDGDFSEISKEEVNKYSARDTHFVLKTDASQEAAVLASRERPGLIIQGPPGTGKSQVIANLVVDRLMRNEKVLVVCQKSVALQVVYNRLGSIGLCRHAALVSKPSEDRPKLAEKLLSLLDLEGSAEVSIPSASLSTEIDRVRKRLDDIALALHKKRDCGRSLRNLYTVTSNRHDFAFDVSDLRGVVTDEELEAEVRNLYEIAKLSAKHDRLGSPWRIRKKFMAGSKEHELRGTLSNLLRLTDQLGGVISAGLYEKSAVVAKLQPELEVLEHEGALSEALSLLDHLDELNQLARVKQALEDAKWRLEPHLKGRCIVGEVDEKKLREINQAAIWTERYSSSWQRFLNPWRKRKERTVENAMNVYAFGSPRELLEATSSRLALLKGERLLAGVGLDIYCPVNLETKEAFAWVVSALRSVQFLTAYRIAFAELPESLPRLEMLLTASDQAQEVVRAGTIVEEAKQNLEMLCKFLPNTEAENLIQKCLTETDGTSKIRLLLNALSSFEEMKRLDLMKEEASPLGWELLERCKKFLPLDSDEFTPESWADLVRNSFYRHWIQQAEEEDPHILDVSQDAYEDMRESFRSFLLQKRDETPAVLQGILTRKASSLDPNKRHSLRNEAGKKSRRKTLRQLFNDYPDEFHSLFPVWLCTPDSVSSLFPLKEGMFDLVIFDEASQLPVENALPAILRAKKIVVAGDEMQLPPADYFKTTVEDDDEDEDPAFKNEEDRFAKSLLEWCKPKMPDVWLTSHYRSEHDALINFSNHAFYAGRMDAATPAVNVGEPPIRFELVEGRWLSGTNRKEAERVASLALELLRDSPSTPTIGIVAMNDAQAKLIDSIFDALCGADPEAQHLIESARNRRDGEEEVDLFVKNIENVQGDERDVIIFSATYAPDEHGVMPSVFGKLSSDVGGNILNVAVTRAKKRMVVVCSFDPAQWIKADTYKQGVRMYKRYLEYAKAISDGDDRRVEDILKGLGSATSVQDLDDDISYDSPFEQEVREAILSLGYKVHTQVGYSGYKIDLGVVSRNKPGSYLLGIECDGAMYHSSKVARERDFYRQRFLEGQGWRIHRIWSRNWWKNREVEVRKIDELLKSFEPTQSKDEDSASAV